MDEYVPFKVANVLSEAIEISEAMNRMKQISKAVHIPRIPKLAKFLAVTTKFILTPERTILFEDYLIRKSLKIDMSQHITGF